MSLTLTCLDCTVTCPVSVFLPFIGVDLASVKLDNFSSTTLKRFIEIAETVVKDNHHNCLANFENLRLIRDNLYGIVDRQVCLDLYHIGDEQLSELITLCFELKSNLIGIPLVALDNMFCHCRNLSGLSVSDDIWLGYIRVFFDSKEEKGLKRFLSEIGKEELKKKF